jgi:hypothetical protein
VSRFVAVVNIGIEGKILVMSDHTIYLR